MTLKPIYDFFGGRTETYAFIFTALSFVLALKGLLNWQYITGMGTIYTFLTGLDIHNDIRQDKCDAGTDGAKG